MNLGPNLEPECGVEVREWFVEQQYSRAGSQGAGQGDALSLAPREGAWHPMGHRLEADHAQGFRYPIRGSLGTGEAVGHVAGHVQVGE